jgi:cytochrome c-type protein NapB
MEMKMKKRLAVAIAASGLILAMGTSAFASEKVASLRGTHDLEGSSLKPIKAKVISREGGFERSYKQQPPLIPHRIEKYRISLRNNGCLKCHDKKHHKKEHAPLVGESHFIARDGTKLDHVSTRRYFCTQCHAPQKNAQPLVKNEFEGLK